MNPSEGKGMSEDYQQAKVFNPLAEMAPTQAGAGSLVTVEQQRVIAEVQARMILARANPRDQRKATELILQDCQRLSLAEDALYAYARGGTDISGPSIKLAEAIARRWGNVASGISEISRRDGYSECMAEAWDLETGYYDFRKFQVRHWRDTKSGGYVLKDERDIYELIANMGQRRKRAVLLAMIPTDVIDAAVLQCEATMRTKADTSPEGVAKMVEAFAVFGVTTEQIEKLIQRKLTAIKPANIVQLKRIYASLRDEMSTPEMWFEMPTTPVAGAAGQSGAAAPAQAATPRKVEKPPIPAEKFAAELPKWRAMVANTPAMAEQIIRMQESKYLLSDEQKAQIRGTNANPAG
jgi:hypothetical protein